jgi:acyl-coenzyme A synthetase/AMP-(fatty) acid ligase/3-hydroxymyristoyl/3-hydroxydecanoyl-(acyl carrier protein) dehydratase
MTIAQMWFDNGSPPMSRIDVYPLITHNSPDAVVAYRHGEPIRVRQFLCDVAAVVAVLPADKHVLNTCSDRYRFTVGVCAALVSGKVTLLPSTLAPEMLRQIERFAPDLVCLTDGDPPNVPMRSVSFPEVPHAPPGPVEIPQIESTRQVAWVFTSGTTGVPLPHAKHWGALVRNVRAEAGRLGLLDGRAHCIVGTVPPQHMYGFESTVFVALQSAGAFDAGRPLYPADIAAAVASVPTPRLLVTTPFHLRALLRAGVEFPALDLIVSATAPISANLVREAEAGLHAPLLEIYGCTETGQIATRRTAHTAEWQLFPDVHFFAEQDKTWASGGHVEQRVLMSDVLEIVGADRFLLHGRSADLINIAGKRSSLGYLNHQLNAVPGVVDGVFYMPDDEAIDGVTRLLAFVVAPELTVAKLTHALRERIDPVFLPRPIFFVEALPRNDTGKLPRDVLTRLLRQPTRSPVESLAMTAPAHGETTMIIPADHPAFAGHFPGNPIVPGVVLLDAALHEIQAGLGQTFLSYQIAAAKFLSPVKPGETLQVRYENQRTAIRFEIAAGQRKVASGTISVLVAEPGRS